MKIVWGLYIYSVLNGMGFETSHSITSLDTYFISKIHFCVITDLLL